MFTVDWGSTNIVHEWEMTGNESRTTLFIPVDELTDHLVRRWIVKASYVNGYLRNVGLGVVIQLV